MSAIKEQRKQRENYLTPRKNRQSEPASSVNTCGGCNACHQMTRIHTASNSPTWGGSDENKPSGFHKPCATGFFQRNLGNSFFQSLAGQQKQGAISVQNGASPVIQRKCSCGGSCAESGSKEEESLSIQAKLKVGPANDIYEQEADRVTDQVMRMPDLSADNRNYPDIGSDIQRMNTGESGNTSSGANLNLKEGGGRPLSLTTRSFMEPRFGVDFGHVRLHTDNDSHQTASNINARAFTHSNHIWFGKGESEADRSLMAHELTHVVQQKANGDYVQRHVESTEPISPVWEGAKDVGSVLIPGYGIIRGAAAYSCLSELKRPMGQITFGQWIPHACGRSLTGYLHSREWDAFGHCWIACEGSRQCGRGPTAVAGTSREIYREIEDTLGGDPHDSYSQDINNQSLGRELAATPGRCFTLCDNAHSGGTLDLTAPQRVCATCATYPNSGSDGPCP